MKEAADKIKGLIDIQKQNGNYNYDEFMDKLDILKKMNTKESKEGVKRFFDNTKQNS